MSALVRYGKEAPYKSWKWRKTCRILKSMTGFVCLSSAIEIEGGFLAKEFIMRGREKAIHFSRAHTCRYANSSIRQSVHPLWRLVQWVNFMWDRADREQRKFWYQILKKRFENKLLHSLVLRRVEGVNSSFKARRHYLMSLYDGMSTDHYLIRVVLVIRYGRENVSPKYIWRSDCYSVARYRVWRCNFRKFYFAVSTQKIVDVFSLICLY